MWFVAVIEDCPSVAVFFPAGYVTIPTIRDLLSANVYSLHYFTTTEAAPTRTTTTAATTTKIGWLGNQRNVQWAT